MPGILLNTMTEILLPDCFDILQGMCKLFHQVLETMVKDLRMVIIRNNLRVCKTFRQYGVTAAIERFNQAYSEKIMV